MDYFGHVWHISIARFATQTAPSSPCLAVTNVVRPEHQDGYSPETTKAAEAEDAVLSSYKTAVALATYQGPPATSLPAAAGSRCHLVRTREHAVSTFASAAYSLADPA